jgi:hypothetical protein
MDDHLVSSLRLIRACPAVFRMRSALNRYAAWTQLDDAAHAAKRNMKKVDDEIKLFSL